MSAKHEEIDNKENEISAIKESKNNYNKLKEKLELVLPQLKVTKKNLTIAKNAFNKGVDNKDKKRKLKEIQNIIESVDKNINKIEKIYIPEIIREINLSGKKITLKETELEEYKKE